MSKDLRVHDRERRRLQDADAIISSDEISDNESQIVSDCSNSEVEEVFDLEESDSKTLTPKKNLS